MSTLNTLLSGDTTKAKAKDYQVKTGSLEKRPKVRDWYKLELYAYPSGKYACRFSVENGGGKLPYFREYVTEAEADKIVQSAIRHFPKAPRREVKNSRTVVLTWHMKHTF